MHSQQQIDQWRAELEATEDAARIINEWLTTHPGADVELVVYQKSQLMKALNRICDLVMLIHSPMPYKI